MKTVRSVAVLLALGLGSLGCMVGDEGDEAAEADIGSLEASYQDCGIDFEQGSYWGSHDNMTSFWLGFSGDYNVTGGVSSPGKLHGDVWSSDIIGSVSGGYSDGSYWLKGDAGGTTIKIWGSYGDGDVWDDTTVECLLDAPQASSATYTQVKAILDRKCDECHNWNYNTMVNYDYVKPGNPAGSYLYQRVKSGSMPPGSRPDLTSSELSTVFDWIKNGARMN